MSEVPSESVGKALTAIRSLHAILRDSTANTLLESDTPSHDLLHNTAIGCDISAQLREPTSGVGSDNVCRWLYDTFQSTDPDLHVVVLRFIPVLLGVYLSRAVSRKPLPGFEAVILAIYAYETKERGDEPMIVNVANMEIPSVYHEVTTKAKNNCHRITEALVAVVSPEMEPCGTVRATKRARICGVMLELYYSKISQMPVCSKFEFCKFCIEWSGEFGFDDEITVAENKGSEETSDLEKCGRIPLPWELFQPAARIVGHCLLGQCESVELRRKALEAAKCLYARAVHDVQPQAILAARSLVRLDKFSSLS